MRGSTVYIHDTAWDSWARMLDEHRIRPDLPRRRLSPGEADFAIVHHELHMNEVDYQIWVADGNDAPDFVLEHDGVPIISVLILVADDLVGALDRKIEAAGVEAPAIALVEIAHAPARRVREQDRRGDADVEAAR